MAKGAGKLTKLKSVMKKWHSFGKLSRTSSSISAANFSSSDEREEYNNRNPTTTTPLYPVYVGKSRRRYLVSSDVIEHPLFQELVGKSEESDDMMIACEVVLFEHMLWMIECNGANAADHQPESYNDLVQFYAC